MGSRFRFRLELLRQLKLGFEYVCNRLEMDLLCFRFSIDFGAKGFDFKFTNMFKETYY